MNKKTTKQKTNKKNHHPEGGNPDPEKQIWYVFAYMSILAVKPMTIKYSVILFMI